MSILHLNPISLISAFLLFAISLLGYNKAKKLGYNNNNIMPIAIGVLIVYILNFIFADLLGNGTAITLQLLRSTESIKVFALLFLSFLLAKQIKKGNYVFFFFFALFITYYGHLRNYFNDKILGITLTTSYFALLMYELLEDPIFHFLRRIRNFWEITFPVNYLKNTIGKCTRLAHQPVVIAVFFIFLLVPKNHGLKQYIKSVLKIPQYTWHENDYAYNDILRFTNEKLTDKNTYLLIPFLDVDFNYYVKHKTFITYFTPLDNHMFKDISSEEFKNILENDLNYSPEKLLENNSGKNLNEKWEELWVNLDEDTIRRWKKNYKLTHVIREKELPLDFPIVYQNQFYIVYEIR